MNLIPLLVSLVALYLAGCTWLPRAGPSASDVLEQAQAGGEILFDIVDVDERVVSLLRGQPKERLARRFAAAAEPPELRIAIGDTLSVSIWESAAGGLFSEPQPALPAGAKPEIEPLAPEARPPGGERQNQLGPPGGPEGQRRRNDPTGELPSVGVPEATPGRNATVIADQRVEADGSISVPYAGRIPAAGRTAEEVQKTIEARLAEKALQPQALVIVQKTAANTVTVLLNESGGASRIWCGSDHRPGSGRISHWPGPGPDRITGWWYSACGTGPNSISGGRESAPLPRRRPAAAGYCRCRRCQSSGSRELCPVVARRSDRHDPPAAARFRAC